MFCAAVYAGMSLCDTVLPLGRTGGMLACAIAGAVTVGNVRAWPLVPLGLGLLRAVVSEEAFAELSIQAPQRFEGRFEVVGEEGSGYVLSVGGRRVLASEPPTDCPPPGRQAFALLRLDPFRSRAEPSGFRAERWSASRDLHGRARVLSRIEHVADAPGLRAAARRAGFRIRESARERLGFGSSAGGDLSTALLLGDRRGLDKGVRDDFRRAGLSHVLALSGAHLAVLALGLATLLRTARVPRIPIAAAILVFVIAYTGLTGAAPPLVRACGTVALGTIADFAGRASNAVGSLGWAGGILLLCRPPWIHDTGFRLSFLATAILALFASRRRGSGGHGIVAKLRSLLDAILLSAIVTLATIPELAGSFGLVSFLAPATNLIAGPPSAAALGWGGLAAFLPVPERIAAALARGAEHASAALLAVVHGSAQLPGGDVAFPALSTGAIVLVLVGAARLAVGGSPGWAERRALAGAVLLAVAAAIPAERITFFDVGQGDSTLLEGGGGAVLIDTGPPGAEGEAPASLAAVRRRRVRPLDAVVLTHAHLDHVGGVSWLLRDGRTRAVVTRPDCVEGAPALAEISRLAAERHVPLGPPGSTSMSFLGGRLLVHDPFRGAPLVDLEENDRSLAASWRARGVSAAFLGDGGAPPQEALWRDGVSAPAPLLLLPHHGSRWATSDTLLAQLRPRLAIASCGTNNPHRHPHAETLERLVRARVALLRTDRDGTIAITATRRGFRVRWTRGFPGARTLFPSLPAFPLPARAAFP